jgi:hypothetical protein
MACPHFVEDRLCRCVAVRGLLIPSLYERERFCKSDEGCKRCPTLRAFEARGGKLPQEVYYALWLPNDESLTRAQEDEQPALEAPASASIV